MRRARPWASITDGMRGRRPSCGAPSLAGAPANTRPRPPPTAISVEPESTGPIKETAMRTFQITRRSILGAALALSAWGAQAQGSYPDRPIQLIVPYTAGGPTDVAARIMAQRLGERLGQTVVV